MEITDRIVNTASQMFQRLGIRSVTMDDIASTLGMSKKTVYQYFKDKDAIVTCFCKRHRESWKQEMDEIKEKSPSALHELLHLSQMLRTKVASMNPGILHDLVKYHPEGFSQFQEHKYTEILPTIRESIQRGITEGVFRNDMNTEIVARIRLEQVELAFNPAVFPPNQFNLVEVKMQMLDLFLHGLMTKEGLAAYKALQASMAGNQQGGLLPIVPSTAPPY